MRSERWFCFRVAVGLGVEGGVVLAFEDVLDLRDPAPEGGLVCGRRHEPPGVRGVVADDVDPLPGCPVAGVPAVQLERVDVEGPLHEVEVPLVAHAELVKADCFLSLVLVPGSPSRLDLEARVFTSVVLCVPDPPGLTSPTGSVEDDDPHVLPELVFPLGLLDRRDHVADAPPVLKP